MCGLIVIRQRKFCERPEPGSTRGPQVFELDHRKSWLSVLTSICAMSASIYLISVSPWYLLPLAWAVAGTAFTGFFVIGHDCGHRCEAFRVIYFIFNTLHNVLQQQFAAGKPAFRPSSRLHICQGKASLGVLLFSLAVLRYADACFAC